MIIVGIPNCKICKMVSSEYPDYRYIELSKKSNSDVESVIKKRLFILNKNRKFPVMFSDDLKSFYNTSAVLTFISMDSLSNDSRTNKKLG